MLRVTCSRIAQACWLLCQGVVDYSTRKGPSVVGPRFILFVLYQTAMDHQQAILKVLGRLIDLTRILTRGTAGIHAQTSALAPTRRAQVSTWRLGRARNGTRGRRLFSRYHSSRISQPGWWVIGLRAPAYNSIDPITRLLHDCYKGASGQGV